MRYHYLIGCLDDSNVGGLLSRAASSFFCGSFFLWVLYVLLSSTHARFHAFLPGTVMFSLETMKYVKRENVHPGAFLATVMRRLDEAMQSLKIGQETVQEPVPKTIWPLCLGPWCRGFGLGQEPWPERPGLNPAFAPVTKGKQPLVLYTPSPQTLV